MKKIIFIVFLAIGLAGIANTAKADNPLPDFSFSSAFFNSDGLKFNIRNVGSPHTSGVWVSGRWLNQDRTPIGGSLDLGAHTLLRGIEPLWVSKSGRFLWDDNLIPSGARYLKLTLGLYAPAQESNSNNNSIEVNRPLSDLAIDSVTLDSTYGHPIVAIKNIGANRVVYDGFTISYGWQNPNQAYSSSPGGISSIFYSRSYSVNLDLSPQQTYIAKPANPSAELDLTPGSSNAYLSIGANNINTGSYQVDESDYTNNGRNIDINISFPDLVIDSIAFDSTYGYPAVAIKNIGESKAKHPALRVYYSWSNSRYSRSYEVNLDLDPGQTFITKPANPSFDLAPSSDLSDGSINLNISTDINGRGQMLESDYGNNYKTINASFVDLVIDSVTFDQTLGYPIVTIKNIGTNTAKHPDFTIRYEYSVSGQTYGNSYNVNLDLDSGQTYVAKTDNAPAVAPVKSMSLTIGRDTNSENYQIFESDYGNNRQTVDVILSDLAIKSIRFDQTYSYPIIAIENIGVGKARHPAFRISYKVNSAARSYDVNLDLDPGQTFIAQPANPSLDSVHRDGVTADLKIGYDAGGNQQLAEFNYKNNKAVLPDFTINSVTFDSAAKTVSITVSNIGSVEARFYAEDMFGPTLKLTCHKVGESSAEGYDCEETPLSGGQSNIGPGAQITDKLRLPALWEDVKYIDVSVNLPLALSELNLGNNAKNKVPVPLNLAKPALLWPTCTAENSQDNNFSVAWSWPEEQKASDYQIEVFDATFVNVAYQEWTDNGTSFTMPTIVPVNTAFFAHYRSATDRTNVSPWSDTALVVCAKSTLTATIEEDSATSSDATSTPAAELTDDIKEEIIKELAYPIAELGNCQNQDACKAYCEKPENTEACTRFGISSGLMTEDEAEIAQTVSEISEASAGPGGCTSKESCESYCEKPENVDACLDYAEQNNIMTADDLAKARKVVQVLKEGIKTPGDCASPITCKNYCSDNTHAVECVNFGKTAGLLTAEEAAEAEKVAPLMQSGQTPGGKTNKEELEAYCDTHRDECDKFFEQAGVKKSTPPEGEEPKENAPSIFEGKEGGGPGGCKTKAECDAYCDSHPGECDQAVIEAGGEVKEATALCSTKEECEAFCNDPANKEAEACTSGTIIIEKESPESAGPTEGPGEDPLEKLRSDIQEIIAQSQSQDCVKQILGEEVFTKFVIEGGIPEKAISREELQPCFEEAKRVIEQEEMIKMQKKPDDPDMGNPPPSGKISTFLASVINILKWFSR